LLFIQTVYYNNILNKGVIMQPAAYLGANLAAMASTFLTSDEQTDILSQTTIAVQQAANPVLTLVENSVGMDVTDRIIGRAAGAIVDSIASEEMKMWITAGAVVIVVVTAGLILALNLQED
jgi:hypothetical protein